MSESSASTFVFHKANEAASRYMSCNVEAKTADPVVMVLLPKFKIVPLIDQSTSPESELNYSNFESSLT